jgi:aspartate--ammonia ligase
MFNYFLINSVKKLNIENNHGVITKLNYINRDEEISNIVSMEKNVLSIEYRYDNKKKAYDKLSNIIDEVYLALTTVFDDLKFEFKQLKHSLSPRLKTIILKAEKEASVSKEALIEKYSSENGVFKLLSTQVEEEAEIDTSNQIEKIDLFFYSRRDSKPMNVVAGHLRQDYDLLKQKDSLNDTLKEEVKHADTLLMKDVYNTINISINLDQVAMFFLDKVHILEVQSGLNSKDLENIFESKGIEHL